MKIISLIAENVKKLVAVEITPTGNLVEITGKNAQGKSSILDSIWWALAGLAAIQSQPIRKGANEARIRLDLGEIVVTRKFARKGDHDFTSSVTVENADGSRFPSPQAMLDGLLGELCFDPLAFARMAAKDQFEALRRFVPGVDFESIDTANDADKTTRTLVNRRQKEASAAANAIHAPLVPPCKTEDESALVAELESAGTSNSERAIRVANREKANDWLDTARVAVAKVDDDIAAATGQSEMIRDQTVDAYERQIEELRKAIDKSKLLCATTIESESAKLREQATGIQAKITETEQKLAAAGDLPAFVDTAALRAKVDAARESNQRLALWSADNKRRDELKKLSDKLTEESKTLTTAMLKRTKEKDDAIAAAQMPVAGLGFGEGIVLLNGLPFDQASDAERLRASVAIAVASQPKLRVIRIRDGSLLDEDGMTLLAEIADQNDMQIWIERVDSTGKVGFVLEDGHLKA